MKRLLALALAALLLLAPVSVFAEDYGPLPREAEKEINYGAAKKGTPRIDGQKDDIYDNTIKVYIGQQPLDNACPQEGSFHASNTLNVGDAYCNILWDESNVYYYCRAYDSNIVDTDTMGLFFIYESFLYAIMVHANGEVDFKDDSDYDMYSSQCIVNVNAEEGYWEAEFAIASYSIGDPELKFGFHLYYANFDEAGVEEDQCEKYTSGTFWNQYYNLGEEEADVTTEPQGDVTTEPQGDVTTAPQGDVTTAPQGDVTTAPKGDVTTAPKTEEKSGCGSVIGGAAIALMTLVCVPAFALRKKEN